MHGMSHRVKTLATVSATDFVTLSGINPYQKPARVLMRKWRETARSDEKSKQLQSGIDLEPVTVQRWHRAHPGMITIEPTRSYSHARFGWQTARPDRFVFRADDVQLPAGDYLATPWRNEKEADGRQLVIRLDDGFRVIRHRPLGILECKARSGWEGRRMYRLPTTGTDDRSVLPVHDSVQVSYTLDVVGVERGWLAATWDTHEFRAYVVPHDDGQADAMRQVAWRWLVDYIEPVPRRFPTDIYRHLSFADVIQTRACTVTDQTDVQVDAETLALVTELQAVSAQIRYLKTTEDHLATAIKSVIGRHRGLSCSDLGRIGWGTRVGSVKSSGVIQELADRLGLSAGELAEIKDRHRGADSRTFTKPRRWSNTEYEPTPDERDQRERAQQYQERFAPDVQPAPKTGQGKESANSEN